MNQSSKIEALAKGWDFFTEYPTPTDGNFGAKAPSTSPEVSVTNYLALIKARQVNFLEFLNDRTDCLIRSCNVKVSLPLYKGYLSRI